jgi:diaminopropionate ammonia-lyase
MATERFGPATATRVRQFLKAEQESPTNLLALDSYATELGLGKIYVKDESCRLGTKAFKVQGVTWAMASWMATKLGCDLSKLKNGLKDLRQLWEKTFPGKPCIFCTCTDGNHGAAMALAAKHLGQKAIVYMPKGSAAARVENIRKHGGTCTVTDLNYDDTVEFAFAEAAKNGWEVLQDTTAENYYEIPSLIMEGYTCMADEAMEQLKRTGSPPPTHIVLQAGVGSMASAVLAYLVEAFAGTADRPKAIICEPRDAACMYASAMKGDGTPVEVLGDLDSMVAGLCCGVPSELAWPILRKYVDGGYAWVDDGVAGNGMRAAAKHGYEAGECGGAGLGLVARLMAPDKKATAARASLGLDSSSRVLVINTEGATDPINYKKQLAMADVKFRSDDFAMAPPLKLSGGMLNVGATPSTADAMAAGASSSSGTSTASGWGTMALLATAAVAVAAVVVVRSRAR